MKTASLSFALIFLVALHCLADERLIVLTEDWPPFNFSEQGKIVGISTDLVTAAITKARFTYELWMFPWKRAYLQTIKNKNTLLFTTSRTKTREDLFKWIGPLYSRQIALYRLKSRDDIVLNGIEDLKNYQLGILRGGSVQEYLSGKGFKEGIHYQTVSEERLNLFKLFNKRVDLIPGSEISMAFRLKSTAFQFSEMEQAYVLVDEGGFYIAANKETSDDIIRSLQSALDLLIKEGHRKKITLRYLGHAFD